MDGNNDGQLPPPSQTSSHFSIAPLPASLLLDQELARKERLARDGNLMSGCKELDDYVLLGGFGRGCVVGVSAEEEEMGLLIGLQTVAHLLVTKSSASTMVVTTLPATALLPKLREALVGQLPRLEGGLQNLQSRVRQCLERISISRVFDIEGLLEVLGELKDAAALADSEPPQPAQEAEAGQKQQLTEIMDSEDEGGLSSPESPPNPPQEREPTPRETQPPSLPAMILVTHTSTLLNALFTGRDKDAAHNTMLLLSSHLHSLARYGPLIMLLNSTTSPSSFSHHHHNQQHTDTITTTTTTPASERTRPPKHPESTLRSIFNAAPPLPPVAGVAAVQQHGSGRRNKPSFGLVFSQMLDLHLLCTRVPRARAGKEAPPAMGAKSLGMAYTWVVEVLLDEMGVYEEFGGVVRRRSREQRWAAVDVDGDGRVVDAFAL
ncbi:hypothetical protein C8A00DRAFT_40569 [Chaetomidium leptoderma]|uniref:Uncharacterized protein n=1 Tax=Chaetomidium leptoderma TaxID=669021 RepID=A0AAN7A1M6_9PEZI|nr:hypothetical protein C8A00DRAFT_40569 [Chaetomidium leptoderma]